MPVDSNTSDMLTPLFDFTNTQDKLNALGQSSQTIRMMNSGTNNSKARSVSETKKKYVASKQNWRCSKCQEQLTHTFQVDHKVDLQFGGTNHISNLAAMCNNCHAEKTSANYL